MVIYLSMAGDVPRLLTTVLPDVPRLVLAAGQVCDALSCFA
jgi:hypothetical protein